MLNKLKSLYLKGNRVPEPSPRIWEALTKLNNLCDNLQWSFSEQALTKLNKVGSFSDNLSYDLLVEFIGSINTLFNFNTFNSVMILISPGIICLGTLKKFQEVSMPGHPKDFTKRALNSLPRFHKMGAIQDWITRSIQDWFNTHEQFFHGSPSLSFLFLLVIPCPVYNQI